MSKFLPVGTKGEMLNTDMIARIIPAEDDGCIVLTKDGQHYHSEFNLYEEVDEYDTVRAVIPCTGVSAIHLDAKGNTIIKPCPIILLMSDGTIEPLDLLTNKDIQHYASTGQIGFIGFAPSK